MPQRDDADPRPARGSRPSARTADTETMPAVRVDGKGVDRRAAAGSPSRRPDRPEGARRPSDPLPAKPANPPVAGGAPKVWPSVEKERARLRREQERAVGSGGRAARGDDAPPPRRPTGPAPTDGEGSGGPRPGGAMRQRLGRAAPYLAWLLVPLALLVAVVAVWRPGPATTPTGTSSSSPAAGATSAPSSTAPAAPAASGAPGVQLDIRVDDAAGTGRSQQLAVLVGGRPLARGAVALPLHLTATAAAGERLTILVPQPSAGARLTCTVAATGAVTGTMTREESGGMLDCSTTVSDIATGGS